jgi:hypothetical protein
MVLLIWFGYRLYPYVPVTSAHKYIRALAPIVLNPTLSTIDLIRFTATSARIGAILDALYGSRRVLVLLPQLIAAELAGRVPIIDATLERTDIEGAGLAIAI